VSKSPTSTNPKKLGRKQILNVIYFVDSKKTRSFKLTLGAVRLILIALAVVLVWSLTSAVTIIYMTNARNNDAARIRTFLATVFDYQSRYDAVFEKAYPDGKLEEGGYATPVAVLTAPTKTVAVASKDAKTTPPPRMGAGKDVEDIKEDDIAPPLHDGDEPLPPLGVNTAAKAGAQVEPAIADTPAAATAATPGTPTVPTSSGPTGDQSAVSIENPRYTIRNDLMVLDFALRNGANPNLAEGHVWAVAKYQGGDGKIHYVGAPRGIQVQTDGTVAVPRASYKYSIRNYKAQSVELRAPFATKGRFTDVEIFLLDGGGRNISRKVVVNEGAAPAARSPVGSEGAPPAGGADHTQEADDDAPSSTARVEADEL